MLPVNGEVDSLPGEKREEILRQMYPRVYCPQ